MPKSSLQAFESQTGDASRARCVEGL